MRGRILFTGLVFILIVLSLNIISAEIMLSQPSSTYNLGDALELNTVVKPSQNAEGFFELNLNCENETKNFYRQPLSLNANEEKKILSSLALTKSFLGGMNGACFVSANFANEERKSQKFKISNKIEVLLNIENMSIEAGKEIEIKGTTLKENGKSTDGFIELTVGNTEIKVTEKITNGTFSVKFSLPENTRAGNYILTARAYEKLQGEETNSGKAETVINVKKTAKKIEIAVSQQNVKPGDELTFKPLLYDQANEQAEGEISVKVYNTYDELLLQKIFSSGEEGKIYLEQNDSSGYWKIKASALGLEAERLFYVEELEKAEFEIINDTLIITNVGNVIYRKAVQISIGGITDIKNLDLDVGESKSFRLAAPEGKYNIAVTDGDESLNANDVSLTGNIVGVTELRKGAGIKYPLVWLFLVVIFGMLIIILMQRVAKRKFYAFPAEKKNMKKETEIKKEGYVKGEENFGKAEHTLVIDGRKENTGIVVAKIKDLNAMKKSCHETINNITKSLVENKGMIYETSDFLIGIFSSPTTRTFANEMIAVRTGKEIEKILNEHNRKFRQKIDFGISLNSGELIVKKEEGKLKFTSIGGTINLARKIAELASNECLLSEDMHKRVMNEVKAIKETRQGVNVYHVDRISERNIYSEFISGFLERQKAGK